MPRRMIEVPPAVPMTCTVRDDGWGTSLEVAIVNVGGIKIYAEDKGGCIPMYLTPEQARELAAALFLMAEEVERVTGRVA